ncbi:MAG: amidohydrolase family protein [Candidatus Acidiferrales bacterium]
MRTRFQKILLPIILPVAMAAIFFQVGRMAAGPLFATAASPAAPEREQATTASDDLQAFAALQPIDTHVHAFRSDPAFTDLLVRLHLHVLDICVADSQRSFGGLAAETARARGFVQASQNHASLCVTFDPFTFEQKDFAANTVKQLRQEFAEGAVAVKIWKNIGMELKTPDGRYVMPDDPIFEPIYRAIAAANKTLIAHVAEPSSCWQPPDPASPDYDYYKEHPEWYMYRHPDHPRKETILAARDHLLAENPKLRVVGAHLGSMETDVDEIARRFDRYPNFAVDMAARMEYLMIQPREKVRNFLIKYQDRVLYGTDLEFLTDEATPDALKEWRETYARDWKFLATDQKLEYRGRQVEGLALPEPVLRRIFHDNAVHWIPGIAATSK